jgi:hypothetical protein
MKRGGFFVVPLGVYLDPLGFSHVTVQLVLSTLNEIGMISSYSNALDRLDCGKTRGVDSV